MNPRDYKLNNPSAMQNLVQGLEIGGRLKQQRLASEAAERKAREGQALQADLAQLRESGRPVRAADFARLASQYPTQGEYTGQVLDRMTAEQKETAATNTSQVYAALAGGNTDAALEFMGLQIRAAENSGDERGAKVAGVVRQMIETDPHGAQVALGMRLAAQLGPEDMVKRFSELEKTQRQNENTAAKVSKTMAEARKLNIETDFAADRAVADLEVKGWQAEKLQEESRTLRHSRKIAALQAQADKTTDRLKREKLEGEIADAKSKREQSVRDRAAELQSVRTSSDNMLNQIEQLMSTPANVLDDALGAYDASAVGRAMDTFDQPVQDFVALLDTLGAQTFTTMIGTVDIKGALSDQEGAELKNSLQSLSRKQSPQQFVKALKESKRLIQKMRTGLTTKYGVPDTVADTPAAADNVDEAEFERLKTQYLGGGRSR